MLSSLLPPRDRNPCSCLGWDRAHTVVLALTAVGVAVVIAIVTVIGRLVLAVAVRKLTFGADVVDVRGSIGRVGWRKVRVRVQRTRSMCRRCLRRPWRLRWILVGLSCRGGALVKRFELVGTLSKSGLCTESWSRGGVRVANGVCFNGSYVMGIWDFKVLERGMA